MSSRHRTLTGDTEGEADESSPDKSASPAAALPSQKQVNNKVKEDDSIEESMDDGNVDSEDGSLMIADMNEGKDTDDTEKESGHSEEEEQAQLIFNGTMTRRQSKQFQDSGGNFAVFSVRSGGKTKNRTCDYCGVVKATPAALVRHIRKHTGEKPFVCQSCGKAYKAKRSLHMHQNSHHRELGQMLPPNPSSLPTQVPITSPVLMQTSPTPAISEATKSLLRETLESSRKARDGNTGIQMSDSFVSTSNSSRLNERLPTPNLVNLLTSDISKKVQNIDEPICLTKGAINLSKDTSDVNTNYIISLPLIKQEKPEEKLEGEVDEEQAQDLSMPTMQKSAYIRHTSPEKRIKCDLCNKSFKHDISRTNHMRTAHNIIISISGTQLSKQLDSFKLSEQKPGSNTITLPHPKLEPSYHKQDMPTDLSISPIQSRKLTDSSSGHLPHDVFKMESPLVTNPDALVLDDSDTLPYNVTSRMVQDFDVEKLIIKGIEKSVLAEDGGNRRVRMTISRETVLVTRLDGINNITGRHATVFKCHLCSRVFTSMLRYHHHLPSHFDAEVQTFDCRYCEAAFRSLSQIVKHLQCHREKFTGLNQSGTGLNSSALLLEEFHRKQKLEQHVGSNVTSGSPANLFSPTMYSDESLSGTPQLEPGERANGGYTCVKCRKSFSREYLLQRHMRIHQNQNMFYCPECESGFSGEMDMIEHRRKVHDIKVTEQLQFSSLLKNISELKQKLSSRQVFMSDRNNNTSDGGLLGSNVFPLVDIKAFDLRRGEAVEVRMRSDVSNSSRGNLSNEKIRKAIATATTGEMHKRKQEVERMNQEAEEEKKMTEEAAKRRKMEHETLRQELARKGMGDVTVVLPDAPPPDDAIDSEGIVERPTDLSVSAEPPSGVGFMARKTSPKSALTSTPMDHVLDVGYKGRDSSKQESETGKDPLASGHLKRPPDDKTDPNPGPSSKSRRKAHKPQKINNRTEKMDHVQNKTSEDNNNNKTTVSSSLYPHSLAGIYQKLKASEFTNNGILSHLMGNGGGILLDSDLEQKKLSALDFSKTAASTVVNSPSVSKVPGCEADDSSSRLSNSGAIDLTADSKDPLAKLSATALLYQASRKCASSSSSSPSASSSPLGEGSSKQAYKSRGRSLPLLTRGISIDSAALDSENSHSQEATSATDLSKTSLLTVQIPASQEGLIGCPQVLWKPGHSWPAELSESLLGVIQTGQWNGKGHKSSSYPSRSRNSSPSPVPSPTSSDTSSTAESRKITTTSLSRTHSSSTRATSLSRTHSRLSIVNEPLDRNSLCKPQVLDDGRSVYTCVICHKQFLSLSDINRHMDFHEDIRPYKCKYCDYYARTNSQLKVHKLRHEGVREFCCRVCNYKGVTQSDLNRHMKSQVHLLRSNHVCSQCGEGFVTPKTLRDHVCCTGSGDKSFENSSANEIDDDINNDEYEEEEIVNSDTR